MEYSVYNQRGKWLVLHGTSIVGTFALRKAAERFCDLENFTSNGRTACNLYSTYSIDKAPDNSSFLVTDTTTNDTFVIAPNSGEVLASPSYYIHDSLASHYISSDSTPKKEGCIPLAKRQNTAFVPTSGFCYDITFPHQQSLGLNLRPQHVMYCQSGGAMFLGCLTVVDASAFLSTIVSAGDLLLRINETELFASGDIFDFDKMTRLITSATVPRTVRFYRPSGSSLLSPAELSLALKISPTAVLNIVQNNTTQSLHVASVDSKAPPAVRKLMSGGKVIWDVTSNPPKLQQTLLKSPTNMFLYKESLGGNVKYHSQLVIPSSTTTEGKVVGEKRFYVGKFETEEEAVAEDYADTEIFVPRKTAKRDSHSSMTTPHTVAAPSLLVAPTIPKAVTLPTAMSTTPSANIPSATPATSASSSFSRQPYSAYPTAQQSIHQFSNPAMYNPGKQIFAPQGPAGYPYQFNPLAGAQGMMSAPMARGFPGLPPTSGVAPIQKSTTLPSNYMPPRPPST